jgi:hypothetical protein
MSMYIYIYIYVCLMISKELYLYLFSGPKQLQALKMHDCGCHQQPQRHHSENGRTFSKHYFNDPFRYLKYQYRIEVSYHKGHILGDIPLHRPYIRLTYGRYLQFTFLKWPLIAPTGVSDNGVHPAVKIILIWKIMINQWIEWSFPVFPTSSNKVQYPQQTWPECGDQNTGNVWDITPQSWPFHRQH